MVGPYVFWYLTIFFTFGWTGWRDPQEFTKFCYYLYGAMASTCILYLIYPNGQLLRPDLSSLGTGWDYDALRWIYGHDTQTNSNPSIHVINAIGVWVALSRDRLLGSLPWFRILLALTSLLVIASTVLVKQHSIVDVFGGLAWAGLWYALVYARRKV
jgi:membrane-associated phospholipid phosphatase